MAQPEPPGDNVEVSHPQVRCGAFVAGTKPGDLPPEIVDFARIRLLDALGSAVAAGRTVGMMAGERRLAQLLAGPGEASFWFSPARGRMEDCAFVNSMALQLINQEDGGAAGHPASNIVPSALAAGEHAKSSGAELLCSIALAYEVQARLGRAASGRSFSDRGFRPTTMKGTFGAAVAASRLLGLDASQIAHAISLGASVGVPGIVEPLQHGTDERRVQVAVNTRNGVECARLAAVGFEGDASALDGESGFCAVFGGGTEALSGALNGLGEQWLAPSLTTARPYPTGGWNIGPTFCAERLVQDGVRAERIDWIEMKHNWWREVTGYVDPGPFRTLEQALLSGNFAVATTLVKGRYDWPTAVSAVGDKRVDELASRIRVSGVTTWPQQGGEVTVHLMDGTMETVGAGEMPQEWLRPSWTTMVSRFQATTRSALSEEEARLIIHEVAALEQRGDLSGLVGALGPGSHPGDEANQTA